MTTELVKKKLTPAERFVAEVEKQFIALAGVPVKLSPYEETLGQHLFLKIDNVLKDFEAKRLEKGQNDKAPYNWDNINMRELAPDVINRVQLGLDALIANHIHPVPYFSSSIGKYNLDLRVGYRGKHYYRTENAIEKPMDVRYELVYSNDVFKPLKKGHGRMVEDYEFDIANPFDRGVVVGGFGYISFEDPAKNVLVLVSKKSFDESMAVAKTKDFWSKYPEAMMYKTLVHRVTEYLPLDPKSVNSSAYAYVEEQDNSGIKAIDDVQGHIERNSNKETIDVDYEIVNDVPNSTEPPTEPPVEQGSNNPVGNDPKNW